MRILLCSIFLLNSLFALSQQVIQLCPYEQTQFNYQSRVSQEGTWSWFLNNTLISNEQKININWEKVGVYTLSCEFENELGCSNQQTLQIKVLECPISTVYLPNCFTPNGDLINNIFIPKAVNVTNCEYYIYNRWGQLVFQGDLDNGWDGTVNGQICPQDVYIWYLTYKDALSNPQIKIGSVTLLR